MQEKEYNKQMKSYFFELLKSAIHNTSLNKTKFSNLTDIEWKQLFDWSVQQGVKAVVFEAIDQWCDMVSVPKSLKMKWVINAMKVEEHYQDKLLKATEFADIMNKNGMHTLTLKGLAVSELYATPNHREFGDLDCCLVTGSMQEPEWDKGYEKGNVLIENQGAKVERDYYKHSHVHYKGLMIENHRFFLPIRGNKKAKELEKHLRKVAFSNNNTRYVNGSKLIIPSADFNALFLTAHAMNHFLYETIRMRHICDWAYFLKSEQQNVDWKTFYHWCDKMSYTRFVNTLNYICHHYLDIKLCQELREDDTYVERVLEDIWNGENIYNKSNSKIGVRLAMVRNFIDSAWKHRELCNENAFFSLMRHCVGLLVDKNPTIHMENKRS